ncbi:helix-turn-helix transcriptional regulator [Vogesella sp. LIG4]|uniref:helix-turn-helix transcriptional regulator n=1 Tax=Vogesella sp. LIG4 TaxID=1192162 RepID=UPI00082000AB|nr:helix-turn-helix transcriptional regulator [Vogesella sp. LIG4]SCK29998.1 Transcriptional regulator, contains XRE-family HTH domain [Vogesella sp. LIG4]
MEQHGPGPLGEFIRSHRERITPQQAGLPAGNRRRAKGLRREEVAQLVGISPTWLTWIEQGRTQSVSAGTLSRLAEVLMLSRAERDYLFDLAGLKDPQEASLAANPEAQQALAQAVGKIASPAYVLDALWNVPAWNAEAARLFSGWLDDGGSGHNLLQFMFQHPLARTLVDDWPTRARRMVAEFRAEISHHHDEAVAELLERLRQDSSEFDTLWRQQDVQGREGGERVFNHVAQGQLCYQQLTLRLAHAPGLKLVMLL